MDWLTERACLEFGIDGRFVETLPELAIQALVNGYDTPSLRILAGLSTEDLVEIRHYFERALRELDIVYSRETLARAALRHLTKQIIDRRIDLDTGLYYINRIHRWEMDWEYEPLSKLNVLDSIVTSAIEGGESEEQVSEKRNELVDAVREYRDMYLAGRIDAQID